MKFILIKTQLFFLFFLIYNQAFAIDPVKYVTTEKGQGYFPLIANGQVPNILVNSNDHSGVLRVVSMFQNDLVMVSGSQAQILKDSSTDNVLIIVGTLGKSSLINQLIDNGKLDKSLLEGKWEKFIIQSIDNPMQGIDRALVIAGSDKRGTIYGMFDLSYQMGVDPWYFWADVPAKKSANLYVKTGIHTQGEPKVKYRGIFINDEAPALTGWVHENYGSFNSQFYDKVFELILRMKGNYIWPAMWQPRMFYVDDPKNPQLANEYGIVIGTTHHEPLARAHAEWGQFGNGAWNYKTNAKALETFWKDSMERTKNYESLITIGMRGDGDEAMSEGTAIELLERIVKKQREIISEVTNKPAEETPQIWALYKEVQTYYDKGMQVPDDVTLLLCDDNWGNLRKLPEMDAKPRTGGYGIYYHFDYVGGPRNYKWINTTQIERTWEQMHLAYKYGVNKLWIVNVGDIKPMEFPVQFFMDYAWNPDQWTADNLQDYYTQWATDVFGKSNVNDIAYIMKHYTKYNARRKPEMLDSATYSVTNYREADRIINQYNTLAKKAQEVNSKLPVKLQDAYYQLVLFPVLASANLNELHIATAKNHLYAKQERDSANYYAKRVKDLFERDSELTNYYHSQMAEGKWNHMMSQTHIGYTYWQQPPNNTLPNTYTVTLKSRADMGISTEGNKNNVLPDFDSFNKQSYYLDIFNKGNIPFRYKIKTKDNWITVSECKGTIKKDKRLWVSIDWNKAPDHYSSSEIEISGVQKKETIQITAYKSTDPNAKGFVEQDGYISIESHHFSSDFTPQPFQWKIVKNLGKTGASIISLPIEKGSIELHKNSPKLTYNVHFTSTGKVKVHAYFAPTINYSKRNSLKYGLSFDEDEPVSVIYNHDKRIENYNGVVPENWDKNVGENIKIVTTEFNIEKVGNHTLNYYRIDEGLALQKIVIETTDLKPSYLGPPESFYKE